MKISDFLKAIEADLDKAPELDAVRDLEITPGKFNASEITRQSFKTPALRVAFLGAPKTQAKADSTRQFNGAFAVFVMTEGRDRDLEGIDLAQAVAERIEMNRFVDDMPVGDPTNQRIDVLYSGEVDNTGLALFSVSWTQTMRLGKSQGLADFDDPAAVIPKGTVLNTDIDITKLPDGM